MGLGLLQAILQTSLSECGTFEPVPLDTSTVLRSYALALGDFNGDGMNDVFLGNDGPDFVYFMTSNGFHPDIEESGQRLGSNLTLGAAAGDLDGDTDLDVMVTDLSGGWIWYNDGAGLFTGSVLVVTNDYTSSVAVGDLNGDTNEDLFVTRGLSVFGLKNIVMTNNGAGQFSLLEQPAFILDRSYGVALGDMDDDGDLDAYVANSGENHLYRNDGHGVFSQWGADSRYDDSRGAVMEDLNGDGFMDVVVANAWPGPSVVYLNRTNGVLEAFPLDPSISDAMGVAVADVTGDSKPDIVLVGWGDDAILVNLDGTNFTRSAQPMDGSLSQAVDAGDLNGDGSSDLVTANYSVTNTLWLNRCIPDQYVLWIRSTYGPADPVNLAVTNNRNSTVTNRVSSPLDTGLTQYVCAGWVLFNNNSDGGDETNCVFTQTNNALLVWRWNTNYWLDTSSSQTFPPSSWQPANALVLVTGYASINYYHFDHWTGDVDPDNAYSNPLALLMDAPKVLNVSHAPNLATNETPEWWLAEHGWTLNFDDAAMNDADGDQVPSWQEFRADTLPTNGDSYLRLTGWNSNRIEWAGGIVSTQFLEWTGALRENWIVIFTNLPLTSVTNMADLNLDPAKGFYRIRAGR
ncbi:MAG: VCBS repeat-containing protein [Lentisphaerota bacterium]